MKAYRHTILTALYRPQFHRTTDVTAVVITQQELK
jgi:translation elongation factor EF-Tu-like GTPase